MTGQPPARWTDHPTRTGRWTRRRARRMIQHEALMLAWVRLGHPLPWVSAWAIVVDVYGPRP